VTLKQSSERNEAVKAERHLEKNQVSDEKNSKYKGLEMKMNLVSLKCCKKTSYVSIESEASKVWQPQRYAKPSRLKSLVGIALYM
jgi:hypothetical protein